MPGHDEKEGSLQGDIFPLSSIPDKWLLVSKKLTEVLSAEEIGPVHGLHATLVLLKNLYYMEDERWKAIRDTVNLGVVKDTKKYGNTSVSMGAAKKTFKKIESKTAGFLNCGTGGIKYQRYEREEILHVVGEYKPKDSASPNALQIGGYKPKVTISIEETSRLLARDLADSERMPWKQGEDVPMFAFVTGVVRQYWEEHPEERDVLEQEMIHLFKPFGIQPLNDSYFLPQDEEGALELLGAQELYVNLAKYKLIAEGTFVVGSFGIGRGSCQWMIMRKDGYPELIGHRAGMVKIIELGKVSDQVMSTYANKEKLDVFLDSLQGIAKPTIALKSGAALLFDMDEYKHLKAVLSAPSGNYPERTVRVANVADRNNIQSITWTGSLDRLCAEATRKLNKVGSHAESEGKVPSVEFETIYREVEGKLEVLDRDAEIFSNELLYLGPLKIYLPPTSHEQSNTSLILTTNTSPVTPAITSATRTTTPAAAPPAIVAANPATTTTGVTTTTTPSTDGSRLPNSEPAAGARKYYCTLL